LMRSPMRMSWITGADHAAKKGGFAIL